MSVGRSLLTLFSMLMVALDPTRGFSETEMINPQQTATASTASFALDDDAGTCAGGDSGSGLLWWSAELVDAGIVTSVYAMSTGCDEGWARHGNECYHVVATDQDWASGKADCEAFSGATMANVLDREQYDFLVAMLDPSCDSQAWTGMVVIDEGGGSWRIEADNGATLDRTFLDSMWDTGAGDPNQYNSDEGSACVRLYGPNYIRDYECHRTYCAVCSRPTVQQFLPQDSVVVYIAETPPPLIDTTGMSFCGRPTGDSPDVECFIPSRGCHIYIISELDGTMPALCHVTVWKADVVNHAEFDMRSNMVLSGCLEMGEGTLKSCKRGYCAMQCYITRTCVGFNIKETEDCHCGLILNGVEFEGTPDPGYAVWVMGAA